MNLKNTRAIAESGGRSRLCHCEERRDEAISIPGMGDCFAALAMTYGAAFSNDFTFALERRAFPFDSATHIR